jgi:hypothetical protein
MDAQITPEPTPDERRAIHRALELEREAEGEPSVWQRTGLAPDEVEEDYATTPPRHNRGATRA